MSHDVYSFSYALVDNHITRQKLRSRVYVCIYIYVYTRRGVRPKTRVKVLQDRIGRKRHTEISVNDALVDIQHLLITKIILLSILFGECPIAKYKRINLHGSIGAIIDQARYRFGNLPRYVRTHPSLADFSLLTHTILSFFDSGARKMDESGSPQARRNLLPDDEICF